MSVFLRKFHAECLLNAMKNNEMVQFFQENLQKKKLPGDVS